MKAIMSKVGGGASAGVLWLPDMDDIPSAREAVLAATKGSEVKVFIDPSAASPILIASLRHVNDTVHPKYAKITKLLLKNFTSNNTAGLDLESSAEVEFITGSIAALNGGLTTSGQDVEAVLHCMGPSYDMYRELYMQALVSDAASTAADASWFGAGLIDTAAKGTNRFMAGSALYLTSNYWKTALIHSAVTRLSTSVYDIWSAASMPTTPSRLTTGMQASVQNTGTFAALASSVRVHGAEAEAGGTRVTDVNAIAFATTLTAYGFGARTAASTTIDMVIEALSTCPMAIPVEDP